MTLQRVGMDRRVTLNEEKPGYITDASPWKDRKGVEFIMTRAQAQDLVKRAKGKTPADWLSWTHLGTALHICGNTEQGLLAAQVAMDMERNSLTLMNVAVILETYGRFDEAMKLSEEANQLDPANQFAGLLYAQGLLRFSKWDEGWEPFEWYSWGTMWQGELSEYLAHWEGEDLAGKRILVIQGGGFGDNLMFFRWFKNLRDIGARITYACPEEMAPLLAGHPWVDEIIPVHEEPGELPEFDFFPKRYDYFVPIMGLARRFSATVDSTRAENAPYIEAIPLAVPCRPYPKKLVGVCWMGAEKLDPRRHRSLNEEQAKRLLSLDGVQWLNLQYGMPVRDGKVWNPDLKNWYDTARWIASCDLVVTVDTGVMHLAGAMGKKCFAILPGLSDWKFLLDRDDMVFYPSVRLFRNRGEGLENALDDVIAALKAL